MNKLVAYICAAFGAGVIITVIVIQAVLWKVEPAERVDADNGEALAQVERPEVADNQAAAVSTEGAAPQIAEPWGIGCNEATNRCQIHQNISATENSQRLLTFVVRQNPQGEGHIVLLSFPHGIYLPTGVKLQFDDSDPITLPFEMSEPAGPFAVTGLTSTILENMRREGVTLTVEVQDQNQREFKIPVTMNGFSKAYEELTSN